MGKPLGVTHYTHPKLVGATAHLMGKAGAKRIRFVESAWATGGPLEEYMLDSGWNVRQLSSAAPGVEFENTNALGKGKKYARFKVPGGGYLYPAYDLNHAYDETDVFVSMAKLKNHETCGVTLSLKNCFGITPAAIYGDDAGADEPNENPTKGRSAVFHQGKRPPAKSAPQELDPTSRREPGYRVPRIVADLVTARPVHLAIIDGVESVAGGEGPWIKGLRLVQPGVLIAGTNPVCTDAVATAVMGYDPRARSRHGAVPDLRQHAAAGRRPWRGHHRPEPHRSAWRIRSPRHCTNMKRNLLLLATALLALAQNPPTMFPPVRGTREMVGAANNVEVEAGFRILTQGGNAVDAGVATVLAAAVSEQDHFGLGGEIRS